MARIVTRTSVVKGIFLSIISFGPCNGPIKKEDRAMISNFKFINEDTGPVLKTQQIRWENAKEEEEYKNNSKQGQCLTDNKCFMCSQLADGVLPLASRVKRLRIQLINPKSTEEPLQKSTSQSKMSVVQRLKTLGIQKPSEDTYLDKLLIKIDTFVI